MTSPQTLADIAALLDLPRQVEELRKEVAALREVLAKPTEELVTPEEAAKFLGMSLAALRRAVTRGTIPCVRIGRRVRLKKSELLKF